MSSSSIPPETPVATLPVIASVRQAYQLVFLNLWAIPAAVFLPVVFYLTWYLLIKYTSIGSHAGGVGQQISAAQVLLAFIVLFMQMFAASLLYVAWHRLVLLGPVAGRPRFLYPIRRRHIRFFGYFLLVTFLITLAIALLMLALGSFLPSWGVALVIPGTYMMLMLKFYFVFPAISVDEEYGLKNAWRQSHGWEPRLIAGFLLCILPSLLLALALNWGTYAQLFTTGQAEMTPNPVLIDVLVAVFSILNTLVAVSFLSLAFKTCTGWYPAEPQEQLNQS